MSVLLGGPLLAASATTTMPDKATAVTRPPAVKVLSYNIRGPAASKAGERPYLS